MKYVLAWAHLQQKIYPVAGKNARNSVNFRASEIELTLLIKAKSSGTGERCINITLSPRYRLILKEAEPEKKSF